MSIFKPNLYDAAKAMEEVADAAGKAARTLRAHEGKVVDVTLMSRLTPSVNRMTKNMKTWTKWSDEVKRIFQRMS